MRRAALRIETDVCWNGDVELEDDCVIAPRGVLRLMAGCRVVSAGGKQRRFIVEGTFLAQGRLGRAVSLDAGVAAAGACAAST